MSKQRATERMTYVPTFYAEGHDPGCGAHFFEPCDCASGIVEAIRIAFSTELARILKDGQWHDNRPPY